MINRLFLIPILFTLSLTQAQLVVRNGAGGKESQLVFVWTHFKNFVNPCLQSAICKLDETDKKTLAAVVAQLDKSQKPLLFVKKSDWPGKSDQLFFTEQKLNSQIFVNAELLYEGEDAQTELEADLYHVTFINHLTSLVLFQSGYTFEKTVDAATKISEFWSQKQDSRNLTTYGYPKTKISVFSSTLSSIVVLFNSDQSFDLTDSISRAALCPYMAKSKLVKFQNVSWTIFQLNEPSIIAAAVEYQCGQNSYVGDMTVNVLFTAKETQLIFAVDRVTVDLYNAVLTHR